MLERFALSLATQRRLSLGCRLGLLHVRLARLSVLIPRRILDSLCFSAGLQGDGANEGYGEEGGWRGEGMFGDKTVEESHRCTNVPPVYDVICASVQDEVRGARQSYSTYVTTAETDNECTGRQAQNRNPGQDFTTTPTRRCS